ncbi:hypothetical protein [Hymenobacter edaphi]|uniref:Uncharacterized protein n=1 Tax=Hymenobacter edaphi TaxID=2211146 RepID=A0A328BRH7_9BACT|nr:hypothetical protein [Hymenobacter edaphi]RAK69870.1 hypothetical protein DLM85_03165 [Hymenobacter edaphi]
MDFLLDAHRRAVSVLLLGLAACQSGPTAAELGRLQQLDATLQERNGRSARSARTVVAALQEQVARNRMQRQDVAVLTMAKEVRAQTDSLTRYLHELRRQLRPAPDNARLAETRPVEAALLGPAADTLQQRLSRYARFLHQLVPDEGGLLAASPTEDPRIHEAVGNDLDGLSFGEFYFRGASVASALTTLGQKEAEVRRLEGEALKRLSMKVGSHRGFERIGAQALPKFAQVPEGETYEAALLLTSSHSEAYGLTMQANGRAVPLRPGGVGRVELAVPADAPAGPASWAATIKATYRGQDTTYRLRVPYTVQRP